MVKEDRIAKDMKPLQKYAMAVLLYGSAARGGSTEKNMERSGTQTETNKRRVEEDVLAETKFNIITSLL